VHENLVTVLHGAAEVNFPPVGSILAEFVASVESQRAAGPQLRAERDFVEQPEIGVGGVHGHNRFSHTIAARGGQSRFGLPLAMVAADWLACRYLISGEG